MIDSNLIAKVRAHGCFALGLALALGACGAAEEPETSRRSTPVECKPIIEACHHADEGSGHAHECHDMSHTGWAAAECTANATDCIAACEALEEGTAGASGEHE